MAGSRGAMFWTVELLVPRMRSWSKIPAYHILRCECQYLRSGLSTSENRYHVNTFLSRLSGLS